MQADAKATARSTRWLSQDLAEAADALHWVSEQSARDEGAQTGDRSDFDVVIVGSGYGAAMVLHELAGLANGGRPLRMAMLERGREYLPGMFPTRMSDLAGHVRYCTRGQPQVRGRETGLFDLRIGPDVSALIANGLGGGSLINAGVMEAPLASVFQQPCWPHAIRHDADLPNQLAAVRQMLQAKPFASAPARADAMNRLSGRASAQSVPITIAQEDDDARGIKACNGCGDCATGCNFRAKLSVDTTLIVDAVCRHPEGCLRLVTGATVQSFRPAGGGGFVLDVVHTDADLRRRQAAPYQVRTARLVIAAGTFGSTELLMRAHRDGLALSSACLGERFSGNGDMIAAIHAMARPAKAVADEDVAFEQRQIGPTITHMIDRRDDPQAGCVVQDLAIPGPLRRMLQEIVATASSIEALTHFDGSWHTDSSRADPAGIDQAGTDRTLVVAVIGTDDANGQLRSDHGQPSDAASPQVGTLNVHWEALRTDPRLDGYQRTLERMSATGHPGATVLANPTWRPLPESVERLFGGIRGPTFTTHPLGGCAMADDAKDGVVNACGQVYCGGRGSDVHAGLLVLDGSVIPAALGINPALTIATLARRAIGALRAAPDSGWAFTPIDPPVQESCPPRPSFREPATPEPQPSTRIELNERMVARVHLMVDGKPRKCRLELRLQFEPQSVADLIDAHSPRRLALNPQRSVLRIVASPPEPDVQPVQSAAARPTTSMLLLEMPLYGEMRLLRLKPSSTVGRMAVALVSWLRNRGLRDFVDLFRDDGPPREPGQGAKVRWYHGRTLLRGLLSLAKLASHAGNRRELQYRLMLGPPRTVDESVRALTAEWSGHCIEVDKTLTYAYAANPVNQFTFAATRGLQQLDGLQVKSALKVDYNYFAQIAVPLLRITSQADQPRALIDLASLGLYLARVMAPLHAWCFRLPDRPKPAKAYGRAAPTETSATCNPNRHRLPGPIARLPAPSWQEITMVNECAFRLTRYRPAGAITRPPVLMIHGYSGSGTTFAHRLLPDGGLAGALALAGHDAWVLDLRSSSGMKTAQQPWRFEDMGCQDIALAIDHIVKETCQPQVDVVAHCMGAAMLSLGLFGEWPDMDKLSTPDQYPKERAAMHGRIRRIVFSQVGPAVVMSPSNTARAYIFSWLRHYIKLDGYRFLPEEPTQSDDMLDRFLNLVPYPRGDYSRENPFWRPWQRTAWVGPRHRMDALFGVTFNLARMGDDVLEHIDEFLGPMNLQTVTQAIHFARKRLVTDSRGTTTTMVPQVLARMRACRVLCLHSEENDLADVTTRGRLLGLLQQAQLQGISIRLQCFGHLDSLIGVHARKTYALISAFLQET